MSRNKRPSGATEIYSNFLFGKFNQNPDTARAGAIERVYQRVLSELAMNRFKWENLPDEIDIRFMEMQLFYKALAVFFKDDKTDKFMALQGSGLGYMNMLDNPTSFHVVGNNFVSRTLGAKNCVPIWANYMRMPDLDIVRIRAHTLAELDRTIEINSDNARQSKVFVSNEQQRLTVENIGRQISEGNNHIKVNGPMQDLEFVKALDLGINPDSLEKLHILRTRLWNETMGLLGIENANQDKKERLVSSEVDANNDQTSSMRNVNLNARKFAAKQINDKYNLKVKVSYYTDEERQAAIAEAPADNETSDTESEVA